VGGPDIPISGNCAVPWAGELGRLAVWGRGQSKAKQYNNALYSTVYVQIGTSYPGGFGIYEALGKIRANR
jgi:hypothetical protein